MRELDEGPVKLCKHEPTNAASETILDTLSASTRSDGNNRRWRRQCPSRQAIALENDGSCISQRLGAWLSRRQRNPPPNWNQACCDDGRHAGTLPPTPYARISTSPSTELSKAHAYANRAGLAPFTRLPPREHRRGGRSNTSPCAPGTCVSDSRSTSRPS